MPKYKGNIEELMKALQAFDLPLLDLNFVVRDALSNTTRTQIHITDRTPVILDPDIGGGDSNREFCNVGDGIDIGGKSSTGNDGKTHWKLSNFICESSAITVDEPVAFVATARADRPIVMTSETVAVGNDLEIDVYSWDINGNPAPGTRFSWRCWAHNPIVVE
jgi:hypothetical protein